VISWVRKTKEQVCNGVAIGHGDHVGYGDNDAIIPVAVLTRQPNGRWQLWMQPDGRFVAVSDHHAAAEGKRRARLALG